MATMNERKMQSTMKEIEKIEKSIGIKKKSLEKKTATCEKLNCKWSDAEWFEHRDTDATPEQKEAWFEMYVVIKAIEDLEDRLATNNKILNRQTVKVIEENMVKNEAERIDNIETKFIAHIEKTAEEREAEYQKWLAQFKADCLKDGIVIDTADSNVITGTAANGKHFAMYINNGYTIRSRHCYTLNIAGDIIFTSGDFSTGYRMLMK